MYIHTFPCHEMSPLTKTLLAIVYMGGMFVNTCLVIAMLSTVIYD